MGVITTRDIWMQNLAEGQGMTYPYFTNTPGNVTAGAAASGFFTASYGENALGTTTSLPFPPSPANPFRLTSWMACENQARCLILARLYLIGTQNLVGTGDKFTHHSATFPVTRTQLGQAAQPLTLVPLIRVTTAPNTTAPVMRLRTAGGAAGYTDQDGNSTIATLTMTLPSATTAVGSTYVWRLEDQDSGVQDISNIENTTGAASTGAADIWGMEILSMIPNHVANGGGVSDDLFGKLAPVDMKPGAPTSGTLTTKLVIMNFGVTTGAQCFGHITAVLDQ